MTDEPVYWFPAKKHGFGWGLPRTWQGWGVIGIEVLLLGLGLNLFSRHGAVFWVVLYYVAVIAALFVVCWVKGEPLRWRWGTK